jgi:CRP-like cAMP-binding protein
MLKALRASPATLKALLASDGEDLAIVRAIVGHSSASSRARIAHVLLELGCRLGHDNGRRIHLGHWFTHQEIADLAGVHRSTVTTAINDWIYKGILRQSLKSLVINKPGALRKAGLKNIGNVFRRRIVSSRIKTLTR